MKIKKQLPKCNEHLHEKLTNSGWITLREPGSLVSAIILSVPFMVINLFVAILALSVFSTISFEEFGLTPDSFSVTFNLGMIITLIIFVIIHELLHLIFIPNFMRSSKTFVGLTFYGGFVVTEEELLKSRYILISIAPFLIASIFLPLALGVLGLLTPFVKLLVLLNAMASSVDILNVMLVIRQVPAKTILKNNGPKTYWKKT